MSTRLIAQPSVRPTARPRALTNSPWAARDASLDIARHTRQVRAWGEPQRGVVGGGVAGMAQVFVALDQHRALLARVIAPDAGNGEARAPPAEREFDDGTRPPPV